MAVREEATEGTAIAERAQDSILLAFEGAEFVLSRDMIDSPFMTGSLTKSVPRAGMWGDDLGCTIPILMRGKGTLTQPEWSVPMKSIMGTQTASSDGVVDAASTTTLVKVKSGCGDLVDGQLIYFPATGEVRRVVSEATAIITLDIPLAAAPAEDAVINAGISWMLSSSTHPSFTSYAYFDGPKRLMLAGTKAVSCEMTFEVGATVPIMFACQALTPTYDTTAQAVTPTLDTTTPPLTCLGVDMWARFAGTAKGTPSQTETILDAPDFGVAVGDKISIEVTAGVWETVAISVVSGDAGGDITLTHASVSVAASATDTVYITRGACANIGDTLTITIEMETEVLKCMAASAGKIGQVATGRAVSIAKSPFFASWQEFLMRDEVVGYSILITLGDTLGNIVAIYIPKMVNAEVALTTDPLMRTSVTSHAVVDATMGNDHEIVIAEF